MLLEGYITLLNLTLCTCIMVIKKFSILGSYFMIKEKNKQCLLYSFDKFFVKHMHKVTYICIRYEEFIVFVKLKKNGERK